MKTGRAGCASDDYTIDHVIPVSCGGTDDLDNLAAACRSCNSRKGWQGHGMPLKGDPVARAQRTRRRMEALRASRAIEGDKDGPGA